MSTKQQTLKAPISFSGKGLHTGVKVTIDVYKRQGEMPSGLWHQAQRSGHPFRKTVVRIPGPSCMANSSMLKTIPFSIALYDLSGKYRCV